MSALTITINQEYAKQRSSTATGFTALGDMTQAELVDLAIHAVKSRDSMLTRCFTTLPTLQDLTSAKVALQQADIEAPVVAPPVVPVTVKTKPAAKTEVPPVVPPIITDNPLVNTASE